MKKDNNKFPYYLPIGISFGVGAAGILSLFPIKKNNPPQGGLFHYSIIITR